MVRHWSGRLGVGACGHVLLCLWFVSYPCLFSFCVCGDVVCTLAQTAVGRVTCTFWCPLAYTTKEEPLRLRGRSTRKWLLNQQKCIPASKHRTFPSTALPPVTHSPHSIASHSCHLRSILIPPCHPYCCPFHVPFPAANSGSTDFFTDHSRFDVSTRHTGDTICPGNSDPLFLVTPFLLSPLKLKLPGNPFLSCISSLTPHSLFACPSVLNPLKSAFT